MIPDQFALLRLTEATVRAVEKLNLADMRITIDSVATA
jgi:hypothetical protein